jgi:hypothetical protein
MKGTLLNAKVQLRFDWHEPARESAELFGLSIEDVESIARNPATVKIDPSTVVREWKTERRTLGDITVVVTYPDRSNPLIWGVYLNLDLPSGKTYAGGGGGQTVAPRTLSQLRQRVVNAGLRIRAGSKHDLVIDTEGNVVAVLPRTPSDHRTVPNVWASIRRKGYPV